MGKNTKIKKRRIKENGNTKLDAGSKPSTQLPPGGLVEPRYLENSNSCKFRKGQISLLRKNTHSAETKNDANRHSIIAGFPPSEIFHRTNALFQNFLCEKLLSRRQKYYKGINSSKLIEKNESHIVKVSEIFVSNFVDMFRSSYVMQHNDFANEDRLDAKKTIRCRKLPKDFR